MAKSFYHSPAYRAKQSERTKTNWKDGTFDFLRKTVVRTCNRPDCGNTFSCIPSDPRTYCSQRCAAIASNRRRIVPIATRRKISRSLTGRQYPNRPKAPAKYGMCANPTCGKRFTFKGWRPVSRPYKYCSAHCAIRDVGSRPTSPRAARAKSGIRADISPTIYFFSRWEANYARLQNFLRVKWVHQPKTFQLKSQKYTPDFYLPESDTYVEIKNYLSEYSRRRDEEFRELYPHLKLKLILKEDYLTLQKKYASKIKDWEYSPGLTK